jgi:5-hydroxyisourate hydrolase
MISTHVLDTALGAPARALAVRLEVLESSGEFRPVASAVTNEDGRVPALAAPGSLAGRTCRLCFEVGAYLESSGRPVFFPRVEVTFLVGSAASYHVPLLLSPFGYSTYRGS